MITDDTYKKLMNDLMLSSSKIAQDESQRRLESILDKLEDMLGEDIRSRTNFVPKKGRPLNKKS